MKKVLIFGGSGQLGLYLIRRLSKNYSLTVLTRNAHQKAYRLRPLANAGYFCGNLLQHRTLAYKTPAFVKCKVKTQLLSYFIVVDAGDHFGSQNPSQSQPKIQ